MTGIVLCADDYGMNAGISRGILELAQAGRISATSAMSVSPGWAAAAPGLLPLFGRIGVGLHLTFTELRPLGPMPHLAPAGRFPPLKTLLACALAGRLDEREVGSEIERQLDRFEAGTGRLPDFVDGHQHVHVLPGIRGPLLSALVRRGGRGRIWLRDPSDRLVPILQRRLSTRKALVVDAMAFGFARAADIAGFRTNIGFSGFSPFDPGRDPARDMTAMLASLGPRPLVMCHPGHSEPAGDDDAIAPARERELAYLASPAFADLLAQRDLRLVPAPGLD